MVGLGFTGNQDPLPNTTCPSSSSSLQNVSSHDEESEGAICLRYKVGGSGEKPEEEEEQAREISRGPRTDSFLHSFWMLVVKTDMHCACIY